MAHWVNFLVYHKYCKSMVERMIPCPDSRKMRINKMNWKICGEIKVLSGVMPKKRGIWTCNR